MENQLGRIGIVYRGAFDPAAEYGKLDFVYFNGGGYIAKRSSTGKPPDQNPDDWGEASRSASVEDRQAAELAARQAAASEQAAAQAQADAQTAQAGAQEAANTAATAKTVAVEKAEQVEALAQQVQADADRAEQAANSVDGPALMQAIDGKANVVHGHEAAEISGLPTSLPASDVYSWAKEKNKPAYHPSEITGLKDWIRDAFFPVGVVWGSFSLASPAETIGGTWQALEAGRFPVAAGSGYAAGATGGTASVALTAGQLPAHEHLGTFSGNGQRLYPNLQGATPDGSTIIGLAVNGDTGYELKTGLAGGNQAHENRPPYIAYNMWRRIA